MTEHETPKDEQEEEKMENGGEKAMPHEAVVRLMADLENLRKEIVNERHASERYAIEAVVHALAPAMDALAYAVRHLGENVAEETRVGMKKVYEKFVQALSGFGIVPIVAEGMYDPKFHEVVEQVSGKEKYAIVEEVGGGWMWQEGERVIVPAKVKIGAG